MEKAFHAGILKILTSTSTLAAGVNLPAGKTPIYFQFSVSYIFYSARACNHSLSLLWKRIDNADPISPNVRSSGTCRIC